MAARHFRDRPKALRLDFKGDQDYLSAVDAEVETLIRERLHAAFPEDSFLRRRRRRRVQLTNVWVVDPIDGTANFVRGIPLFCISMAFVRDGRVEIGVIYDPVHDELYAARRGGGATLDGRPMRVSGLADIRQATIEAGWSTRLPPAATSAARAGLEGCRARACGAAARGRWRSPMSPTGASTAIASCT